MKDVAQFEILPDSIKSKFYLWNIVDGSYFDEEEEEE